KLVRDLHTTNVDQLHAYLGQHEYHANEVRLMHERNSDPLALVSQHQLHRPTYQHHQQSYHQPQFQQQASTYQASSYATSYHTPQFVSQGPSSSTHSISYPVTDTSSLVNNNAYMASSLAPQIDYAPMVQQSSEYSPIETGLVVPVFQKGDDPIDAINHIMSFLTAVVTLRGSCTSLTELEYYLEEVYKATTDQLDWVNPEGQQYPHNLLQPLPLIPDNRGRRIIPFTYFINNDLEYLQGDLVPRTMWIQEPLNYDKHALWGVSHWGRKRQQFYGFAVNQESALDVYSKRRIIAVTDLKIVEWHNYKHLDWISVRRDDDKIYKFKEGDFKRLCLQDIEDMLLLLVQRKLSNLTVEERFAFNVSLRMF
nr:hypothetical protein [Tanacetum cinerariifolium]